MDFINIMSVDYRKGSFIMKASFQNRANYHIRTSVGTDMGICATIHPEVRYFIIPHISKPCYSLTLTRLEGQTQKSLGEKKLPVGTVTDLAWWLTRRHMITDMLHLQVFHDHQGLQFITTRSISAYHLCPRQAWEQVRLYTIMATSPFSWQTE